MQIDNARDVELFFDGAAKEFVAICDTHYIWKIYTYENGQLIPLPNATLPGMKHAGLSMDQYGSDLIVWLCARMTNVSGDPYPPVRHVIPGVCTPRKKVFEDIARRIYNELLSKMSSLSGNK